MRRRLTWVVSVVLAILILTPSLAQAADATATPSPGSSPTTPDPTPTANVRPTEGSYIGVTLVDSAKKAADGSETPVPGVTISVLDSSKTSIGSSVTDQAGQVFVPIPGRGTYTVQLDPDSLPEGLELSGSAATSKTVSVLLDGGSFVQFGIGVTKAETTPFAERLAQAAVHGLKLGLVIALAALGLSMIFGTTGLTNFAHGEIMTFGAFATYVLNVSVGLPVIPAALLSVLLGLLFGWLNDRVLWRPLRHRGLSLISMMIVSIGLSMFLRAIYQFLFGSTPRRYTDYVSQRQIEFGPIGLAPKDLWVMGICLIAITLVCIALMTTRIGKATRAVADNPALAASSGLRVDGVIATVWIVGAGLTALAGTLAAVLFQATFTLGFNLLLLLFAAVTLGGLGTIWGALMGSIVIGVLVNIGPVFGVPESIKDAGALAVLILVLLVRPQGILGRRERIG